MRQSKGRTPVDRIRSGQKKRWSLYQYSGVFLIIAVVLLTMWPSYVSAMKNPAAVYCTAMGYTYITESTPDGDYGFCQLPNGKKVDAWAFFRGEVATDYSYCASQGYQLKIVNDESC